MTDVDTGMTVPCVSVIERATVSADSNSIIVPLSWRHLLGCEFAFIFTRDRSELSQVLRVYGAERIDDHHSRLYGRQASAADRPDPPQPPGPKASIEYRTASAPMETPLHLRTAAERKSVADHATHWQSRFTIPGRTPPDTPLDFIREQLDYLAPGQRILFLGAGEGRNAVWAAHRHATTMVELTSTGCQTAQQNAQRDGVDLDVRCADLVRFMETPGAWDVISMSYVQLESERSETAIGAHIRKALTPGGIFVGEFSTQVLRSGFLQRLTPRSDVNTYEILQDGIPRIRVIGCAD